MSTDRLPPALWGLRRAVLTAFAPLLLVVVGGATAAVWMAWAVHHDVLRLFEELREVALARTLVDELQGVEQWVQAAPDATAASHALVFADVSHHETAARTTIARFARVEDPSRHVHQADEARLLQGLADDLATMHTLLQTPTRLDSLAAPLATALQAAMALMQSVDEESREIGVALDLSSDNMALWLLAVTLAGLATLGWLGWLLVRRVLQPLRQLRDGVVRFGKGATDLTLPQLRRDEVGELATAFQTMAAQLTGNQRELEQRVEARSREVLRTAQLAQLGTLAAGIAHEINNPLASIVACAEGLLRDLDDPSRGDANDVREYLQILRREGLRARDVTSRLLRFAHQNEKCREPVQLGIEAREVGALFAHQMADARVQLVVDAGDGPTIAGDPAEWRQVLFNLLRNALDASPPGGAITVRCRQSAGEAHLTVADEGQGVAEANVDRIFEPFFTTKQPGRGTGLGLAIVHRIITAHGGSIRLVTDAPGACFEIVVPIGTAGAGHPAR